MGHFTCDTGRDAVFLRGFWMLHVAPKHPASLEKASFTWKRIWLWHGVPGLLSGLGAVAWSAGLS